MNSAQNPGRNGRISMKFSTGMEMDELNIVSKFQGNRLKTVVRRAKSKRRLWEPVETIFHADLYGKDRKYRTSKSCGGQLGAATGIWLVAFDSPLNSLQLRSAVQTPPPKCKETQIKMKM